jgi:hypothetical protein
LTLFPYTTLFRSNQLESGGLLLIRDGITDDHAKFVVTQKTENWSIRLLKFNKSTRKLHFFHSDFIRKFAENNNLAFEMHAHSDKTTNHLFILRKP